MSDRFACLLADIIVAFVGLDHGLEVGGEDAEVLDDFGAGKGDGAAGAR